MMKPVMENLRCWMAIWLFFCMQTMSSYATSMFSEGASVPWARFSTKHDYRRYPEVEMQCNSLISSASRLEIHRELVDSIKNELSFYNGDWEQDSGSRKALVPIPFSNSSTQLFRFASFSVSDVEEDRRSQFVVKVSGSMIMQITDGKYHYDYIGNSTMDRFSARDSSQFEFMPDFSSLSIFFEGIYTESDADAGERVLCLLGETSIPTPVPGSSHLQEPQSNWRTRRNQFKLLQDDRILMVLRYPKSFSLTSRVIHGEMTSLHDRTDARYFSKISLSSQLGSYSNYQFREDDLVSKACTPYPHRDRVFFDQIVSPQVCQTLNQLVSGTYVIFPNWNCSSSREYCNELGPFRSSLAAGGANTTVGVFGRSADLAVQDVRCEMQSAQGSAVSTKVSAIFRVIPEHTELRRSGLDGMTLAAEGTWSSEGGQLCMVGCLGPNVKRCDTRVLMHLSVSFSISQRYVMVGSISSSSSDGVGSYYPLSFGRRVTAWELQSLNEVANISYTYIKFKEAMAFLENKEPFELDAIVKKTLLRYPKMEEGSASAFSSLANDLSFSSRIFTNSWRDASITVEIFTIGSFFRYFWGSASLGPAELASADSARTEGAMLLNVSATLTISEYNEKQFRNVSENNEKQFRNISKLFLEGVYNPVDGKMYMIACRDAHPSWNLSDIFGLENGMDCSINVKIEYPPETASWLVTNYAKIVITSQRTDDDPIYFSKIELRTAPIAYTMQREDMLSRENVEGVLQILTLSIAVACIFSQLVAIRKDVSTVPYISIVMLAVLALGYSIPLIGRAGSLFFGRKSKMQQTVVVSIQRDQLSYFIDYFAKILFLVALLLTLRLLQRVWKSRNRLSSSVPLGSKLVPKEKWVFFACLCIHAVGFLLVMNANGVSQPKEAADMYSDTSVSVSSPNLVEEIDTRRSRQWGVELEEYVGLVQDLFLLPQVIGNFLWQLDGKPLKKAYYVGITVLRILPHVYDYARTPISYPYEQTMSENVGFVNPELDFYSKFGDIAISVIASLLAVVVFCQQRTRCERLYRLLGLERFKALFLSPRAYERLPAAVHEAELVGVGGNADRNRL